VPRLVDLARDHPRRNFMGGGVSKKNIEVDSRRGYRVTTLEGILSCKSDPFEPYLCGNETITGMRPLRQCGYVLSINFRTRRALLLQPRTARHSKVKSIKSRHERLVFRLQVNLLENSGKQK
jgi:hypothetical protein